MQALKIPEGCKKIIVDIHNPQGAWFCEYCYHYTLVDQNNVCQCCFNKITRKRRYRIDTKNFYDDLQVFVQVLEKNKTIVKQFQLIPYYSDSMPGFVVTFGHRTRLVSIKYFAEYLNIPNKKDMAQVLPLLSKIRQRSMLLMPGTKVI